MVRAFISLQCPAFISLQFPPLSTSSCSPGLSLCLFLSLAQGFTPVLVCPAQLSVPADYEDLSRELEQRGFKVYTAPLTRLGWITGLAPSAFTLDYLRGTLQPASTLKFYYEAIDSAVEAIDQDFPGKPFHLLAHSIGGWVGRSWMGESCSDDLRKRIVSFTTLGTPHNPPPSSSILASIDQTRGLLSYVNSNWPGAYHNGIRYTSVVGEGQEGKFSGEIEELLAFVSYLPLSGTGEGIGDGIIPSETAYLEGSDKIVLPRAKHSGFVPTLGDSIKLKDYPWYGDSEGVEGWVGALRRR
ncbi:unnamed protein product [Chrysoparadoxa australica]